ncbi:hypothetical protein KDW46_06955 [Burkholderia vietnamiensis]|nr:hypothetical protein [Burkholderia vietnamiensis]
MPVVKANVVPHEMPVPLVYFSALFDVLQLGIANAVGLALDPVAFARIVFAAIAAMPLTPIPPHAGELDEPVETIAWPADEPAGFSNWTGVYVTPKANAERRAQSAPMKIRFILVPITWMGWMRQDVPACGE